MSNARILADLMGASTTVPSSKLSLTTADMPTGSVLQVKQGTYTAPNTITSQTFSDTGLTVSITPSSTSSKIYIASVTNIAWDNQAAKVAISLFRDSTEIFLGDASGSNRARTTAHLYLETNSFTGWPVATSYLDSPSTTSAITYKIKYRNMDPQGTVGINRGVDSWTDSSIFATSASSIVAMEIAG